jgi:hypothetical protein
VKSIDDLAQPLPMEIGKLLQGIPDDVYHGSPGLSASGLQYMRRSARHYQYFKLEGHQQKETEALKFGALFHKVMENGPRFLETFVVEPRFTGFTKDGKESAQSKEAKDAKKAWYAGLAPDTKVVTQDDLDTITGMLNAAMGHSLLRNLFKDGVRETSLWVEDRDTGVLLKCRPDFISKEGFIVDIKTTRDASLHAFDREIFDPRGWQSRFYALQAAHYVHCAKLAGACRSDSFMFVAMEKEAPWGITVRPLGDGALGAGDQWRASLTRRYAECLKTNVWPKYPEQAVLAVPPDWMPMPEGEEA